MRAPSVVLILSLLSQPLFAQSELDQFIRIFQKINAKANEMLIVNQPEFKKYLPKEEWDTEYLSAAKCMYERYTSLFGSATVARMIREGEVLASQQFVDMEAFSKAAQTMSRDIPQETQQQVSNGCGITVLNTKRMKESGLLEALMGTYAGDNKRTE